MSNNLIDEFAKHLKDMPDLTDQDIESYGDELRSFGLKTSHVYRSLLFAVMSAAMKDGIILNEDKMRIILVATAVKSKTRIMEACQKLMADHAELREGWPARIMKFYMDYTVQYVSEADRAGGKKFPVVNIPNCVPSLAAMLWKKIHADALSGMAPSERASEFLKQTFAAQMNMDRALKEKQKELERDFWNNKVKFSKNQDKSRFLKGFQEEFWNTKAADMYPFIRGGVPVGMVFSQRELEDWLSA